MSENNKAPESWEEFAKDYVESKKTASETMADLRRESKAKNFAIGCLTVGIVVVAIGAAVINYYNDRDWRELFSSYDYVSQDGEGYNYYNSDVEGDVNNGTENQEAEE